VIFKNAFQSSIGEGAAKVSGSWSCVTTSADRKLVRRDFARQQQSLGAVNPRLRRWQRIFPSAARDASLPLQRTLNHSRAHFKPRARNRNVSDAIAPNIRRGIEEGDGISTPS